MNMIVLDTTESTNTALKEILNSGAAPVGAACYSENQTSGYGRRGRFWHSEKGKNIALSLSLEPFKGDELISLMAGVAVLGALRDICGNLPFALKWPNDILLADKKLAGISCEKIFTGNVQTIILGIGINVNNTDFPEGLVDRAISLRQQTGKDRDLTQLRDAIIHEIYYWLDRQAHEVLQAVRRECINLGQHVRIVNEDKLISEGIATDIDEDGGIVIITDTDTPQKYHSGEISLR
ncbi:MAG: biotin--[acetyl-CoA-carboxylase] ligase [Defluviitaleaceae bacterium]|nr:biotin--[acetyl-CoA-carboxylase] ligase [Defluviitaleaceae bacterium]